MALEESIFGTTYQSIRAAKVLIGADSERRRTIFVEDTDGVKYRILIEKGITRLYTSGPDPQEIPFQ